MCALAANCTNLGRVGEVPGFMETAKIPKDGQSLSSSRLHGCNFAQYVQHTSNVSYDPKYFYTIWSHIFLEISSFYNTYVQIKCVVWLYHIFLSQNQSQSIEWHSFLGTSHICLCRCSCVFVFVPLTSWRARERPYILQKQNGSILTYEIEGHQVFRREGGAEVRVEQLEHSGLPLLFFQRP